ncbi:MAG: DUF971 domain-containing protein [Alphaproteobacteria bacterium]
MRVSPDKKTLQVSFEDGVTIALSSELLRVESPSAEVQGHGAGQKTTPVGKRNVTITRIDPVGHYAVRITFSDGHDSGLFSWDILYDYGQRQDSLMADYIERLAAAGHSRD